MSHHRVILLVSLVLLAGCDVDTRDLPSAPSLGIAAQRATSTFPNVDGSFGPFVLASCNGGYDLVYEQSGTVTMIVTTDGAGNLTRVQNVWNLTARYTNSVTGYSISGPSHGPDQLTFNTDGTQRLVQYGLIVNLRTPDGIHLVDVGRIEFLIDVNGITLVGMSGPHPIHEGFPERPVLCALVNH
jgi:hypothetical protein